MNIFLNQHLSLQCLFLGGLSFLVEYSFVFFRAMVGTAMAGVLHAILIVALCVLALYDSPELMSSSNFFQVQFRRIGGDPRP